MITTVRWHESAHLQQIAPWWDLGVPWVQRPTTAWVRHLQDPAGVHAHCTVEDGRVVVFSQVDADGGDGSISLVVHPLQQRRGWGRRHLNTVEDLLCRAGLSRLVASVDEGNTISERFFTACGYIPAGRDGDGLLVYAKILGPGSGPPIGGPDVRGQPQSGKKPAP